MAFNEEDWQKMPCLKCKKDTPECTGCKLYIDYLHDLEVESAREAKEFRDAMSHEYLCRFTDITHIGTKVDPTTAIIFDGEYMSTGEAFEIVREKLGTKDEFLIGKVFLQLFQIAWKQYDYDSEKIKTMTPEEKVNNVNRKIAEDLIATSYDAPCLSCDKEDLCSKYCQKYVDWLGTIERRRVQEIVSS